MRYLLFLKDNTGTAQITVNSANKVNSDNEAVEVLDKNFAEYVALTYTVKCTKGVIDTYSYTDNYFSVTGADGLVAESSSLNTGALIPDKLEAGQSFEFVYGYGLKSASKTIIVNFNNDKWSGDITHNKSAKRLWSHKKQLHIAMTMKAFFFS